MSDLPMTAAFSADDRSTPDAAPAAKTGKITGWILSVLAGGALFMGGMTDVLKADVAVEGLKQAGFPAGVLVPLGLVTCASALLYLIPWTAGFGALLLTGYLGGAVATHVRMGDPVMFYFVPPLFAAVLWTGLLLRDRRFRALLPISA